MTVLVGKDGHVFFKEQKDLTWLISPIINVVFVETYRYMLVQDVFFSILCD